MSDSADRNAARRQCPSSRDGHWRLFGRAGSCAGWECVIVAPQGVSSHRGETAVEPLGRRGALCPLAGAQARAGPVCNPLRNDRPSHCGVVQRAVPSCPPGKSGFSATPQWRTQSIGSRAARRSVVRSSRFSSMHCRLTTLSSRRPPRLKRRADMSNCEVFLRDSACTE